MPQRNDFDLTRIPRDASFRIADPVKHMRVTPTVGNHAVVIVLEGAPGNGAAILAKMAELEALSETYVDKQWPVTAQDGKQPQLEVRAIVRDNIEAG